MESARQLNWSTRCWICTFHTEQALCTWQDSTFHLNFRLTIREVLWQVITPWRSPAWYDFMIKEVDSPISWQFGGKQFGCFPLKQADMILVSSIRWLSEPLGQLLRTLILVMRLTAAIDAMQIKVNHIIVHVFHCTFYTVIICVLACTVLCCTVCKDYTMHSVRRLLHHI